MRLRNGLGFFCLFAAMLVAGVGCGGGGIGGGGNVGGGQAGQRIDLSGLEITVGSKEFTEQLILGEIAIQALEARGATVEDETGITGTEATRDALVSGEIDAYWEYTGTGSLVHLGRTEPIRNPDEQYETLSEEDLSENDIRWLEPAPANNTYAIAVRSEAAPVLGVTSLSSLAVLSEIYPENTTLCAADEFLDRELDGLPGMEEAYDFEVPPDGIVEMEEDEIYAAVDEGEECNFGEVFQTDGRINSLDLTLLEDDANFFPPYNPSLTIREEVIEGSPRIADVFAPISEELDNETLRGLSEAVDVDGETPEDAARRFLRQNGFL